MKSTDQASVFRSRVLVFGTHRHPEQFARNRIELTGADGLPLAVGIGIYLPRKDGNEIKPLPTIMTDHENEN